MEKPEKKIVNKRKADDSVAEGKKKAGGKKSTGASPRKAEKRAKKDDNGGKAADKDAPPERPRYVYGNLPEGFKVMPSAIPNKMKRSEVYQKIKAEKKRLKSQERNKRQKERAKLGDKAPPKLEPRTIENTREFDETIVKPDDAEVIEDEAVDEFSAFFRGEKTPKILFTTSQKPTKTSFTFIEDLLKVIPNSSFRKRGTFELKKIVTWAKEREYTALIVINEDRGGGLRGVNGALLINLPEGPTFHFKITSVKLMKKIRNHATPSEHLPELILNNFNTRLGHTVGRMFASIFPLKPDFKGRRVVTFHNQRDFIFFRHHRYIYENEKKARLQEIGPRFTLKLRSIQHGTFDSEHGEYEWVYKKENETSRRRFFL